MPPSPSSPCSRRSVLAGAVAAPLLLRSGWAQRRPPSERLTAGVIGLGSRGFNLLDDLARCDARVVALCDVDQEHYRDRPWGKGPRLGLTPARDKVAALEGARQDRGPTTPPAIYVDYRQLLEHEDLDVVVVATPDHWHALCTLAAVERGKDVYCEKPLTHTFAEGLAVCAAVRRRGVVFQTGSQQRSDPRFRQAANLVRHGVLGRITRIDVGLPSGYELPQGETELEQPRATLDYDFWCGPAAALPYMRARHHRWWRGARAFGGGVLMDWIGHHNDIAHWSLDLDADGPREVTAVHWVAARTPIYDTPWKYEIVSQYADDLKISVADSHRQGVTWIGEEGWLHVDRGRTAASDPRWLEPGFLRPSELVLPESDDHMRNFLDCVRSRRRCIADAETAHRSITPGHLGFVSHALGRTLRWDAQGQRILDDPEADRLLREVSYREPWRLASA